MRRRLLNTDIRTHREKAICKPRKGVSEETNPNNTLILDF